MRVVLVLLSGIFIGCFSTSGLEGVYSNLRGQPCYKLTLNNTMTYEYEVSGDLFSHKSNGQWFLKSDSLFLLSSNLSQSGLVKSIKSYDSKLEEVNFQFMDEYGIPLSFAAIVFDDGTYSVILDESGICSYKGDSFAKLKIEYLKELYYVNVEQVDSINLYKFYIRLSDLNDSYSSNSFWIVNEGKLISKDSLVLIRKSK